MTAGSRMPPWRAVVLAVACAGALAVGLAAADLARTGLQRPGLALGGCAATVLVNRLYVIVARRGSVLEGIDLAEAPIVALALVLPPGEALLTFVAGSALVEIPLDRAWVKKVFNIGVRASGAGLLLLPVLIAGHHPNLAAPQYVAVAGGAVLYTLANAFAVALVIASVAHKRVAAQMLEGLAPRLMLWAMAVATGLAAGFTSLRAPGGLVGFLALLLVVSLTTRGARQAQRDRDRLRRVLEAGTRVQAAPTATEQEAILLEVAKEELLWKDVAVRDTPPEVGERGAGLYVRDGRQHWLVATLRPDSDPWSGEDTRILEALAHAAAAAYGRASLQAELARQARLDPLTGAANRRHFDEVATRLSDGPDPAYGIVLCDLDRFKEVNDRLGHEAGDELLRITSARLTAAVRSTDLVARLGGDEFAVLVPGVDSPEAMRGIATKIAARLGEPVQAGRWRLPGVAMSMGLAAAPCDGTTPSDVLRAADQRMYAVKRAHSLEASLTLPDQSLRLPEPHPHGPPGTRRRS